MRARLAMAVLLGACSPAVLPERAPDAAISDEDAATRAKPDAAVPPADAAPAADLAARSIEGTFTFALDAGAFPPTGAHPSVLVYAPPGLRASRPLGVLVYLHGFDNCVENIVRDGGAPCTAGQPARVAYALADQLDRSGRAALLVAPEVAYDQASGAPGNLGAAGGLRALLAETLRDLAPQIGALTVDDLGPVLLASHSGGYQAAAAIVRQGGVPIDEVWLLDSLYGDTADFARWIADAAPGLESSPPRHRFADVYTAGGGTLAGSQALADGYPHDAGWLVDDRVPASTWPDATYGHGALFKYSMLSHDGVPRYYVERLLATSVLSPR